MLFWLQKALGGEASFAAYFSWNTPRHLRALSACRIAHARWMTLRWRFPACVWKTGGNPRLCCFACVPCVLWWGTQKGCLRHFSFAESLFLFEVEMVVLHFFSWSVPPSCNSTKSCFFFCDIVFAFFFPSLFIFFICPSLPGTVTCVPSLFKPDPMNCFHLLSCERFSRFCSTCSFLSLPCRLACILWSIFFKSLTRLFPLFLLTRQDEENQASRSACYPFNESEIAQTRHCGCQKRIQESTQCRRICADPPIVILEPCDEFVFSSDHCNFDDYRLQTGSMHAFLLGLLLLPSHYRNFKVILLILIIDHQTESHQIYCIKAEAVTEYWIFHATF